MKKRFWGYAVCWALMLALFNVIVFVTPDTIGGIRKITGGFWIGYGFTTAAFIGHLVCAFFALGQSDKRKIFYNIPLIGISYGALATTLVVGGVFMAIPVLPSWLAAVICSAVLVFNIIAVVKAKVAAEIVSDIDKKIAASTAFIKELTAQASVVVLNAEGPEQKAQARRVYDAIRYSDPVSNDKLAEVEREIADMFAEFEKNTDPASANKLIALLNKRAALCKMLKK